MDFRKGQKPVAIAAVVHKGSLQRGFYPRHFRQINIASYLPFVLRFKVKFLNFVSIHHHNTGFFRVRGIDKHLFCHYIHLHHSAGPLKGGPNRRDVY